MLPPLTELMAGAKGRRDGGVAPVVEGEPVRQRLEATYFDTADLRLASAGLTLRRRTGTKHQDPARQVMVRREDRIRLLKMKAEAPRGEGQ